MMARLVYTIRTDMSGVARMFAMIRSLVEALAQLDASIDDMAEAFEGNSCAGLFYKDKQIASITSGKVVSDDEGLIVPMFATPTFHLPAFASDIVARIPAIRVEWVDGWPMFKAMPRDSSGEDDPDPLLPILEPLEI